MKTALQKLGAQSLLLPFSEQREAEAISHSTVSSQTSSQPKDNTKSKHEQTNFKVIVSTVKAYKTIFTKDELAEDLGGYLDLSPQAQTVLLKLFLRKRQWFNSTLHL